MNINKLPKAILFDWDNTMLDTWSVMHNALNHTFKEMGREEWSTDKTKQNVGLSAKDFFSNIFGDESDKAIHIYRNNYLSIFPEDHSLYDGAVEVLDAAKNLGIYCAVVSNKTGSTLRSEVERFKINHYFDKVIGSMDGNYDKPHREPVDLALHGSNIIASEDVWFIGDSIVDMQCAHNSGCMPILFGDLNDSFIEFMPSFNVLHHNELHQIIKSIK